MSDIELVLPTYGVVSKSKPNKSLTLNWYRNAHYRASNDAKKRFKLLMSDQLRQLDQIEGKLVMSYRYYAKRKGTDMDNFVSVSKKFMQDALVEFGLITDDNCDYIVRSTEDYMGIDKKNPRIELSITIKQ